MARLRDLAVSDLFGMRGLQYLEQVHLPQYHQDQVQSYLCLYQELMKQIEPLTEAVNGAAKNDPIAKLLMSVPGIGAIVNDLIATHT